MSAPDDRDGGDTPVVEPAAGTEQDVGSAAGTEPDAGSPPDTEPEIDANATPDVASTPAPQAGTDEDTRARPLDRPPPLLPPPPPEPALPPARRAGWGLHGGLFVVTFFSAVLAYTLSHIGAPSLRDGLTWVAVDPGTLAIGIPFAATLMAILLAHEMGHYLTAKRAGVDQSLPYFIPAPTIFGTLGALILMRSQPRDRHVLLDVAVMGPYAGLVLAIPATIWGLSQSTAESVDFLQAGDIIFGDSALFWWLRQIFGPDSLVVDLHPVAMAGWVGMFVTSLNLIPAAQLDGGHIAYALFGHRQERISMVVVAMLFGLGLYLGFPRGSVWMFWALFLFIIGLRHPPVRDEEKPLPLSCRVSGWVALLIFAATFTPVPIEVVTSEQLGQPPERERLFRDPHERFERQAPQKQIPEDAPSDGSAEEFHL